MLYKDIVFELLTLQKKLKYSLDYIILMKFNYMLWYEMLSFWV